MLACVRLTTCPTTSVFFFCSAVHFSLRCVFSLFSDAFFRSPDSELARLELSDDFLAIEPPLSEADFSFCLEASEGAIDLFDFSF